MQGARAEGEVGAYRRGAGNDADARPPPRPAGLRLPGPPALMTLGPATNMSQRHCLLPAPLQRASGPAAEWEVIFARALRLSGSATAVTEPARRRAPGRRSRSRPSQATSAGAR